MDRSPSSRDEHGRLAASNSGNSTRLPCRCNEHRTAIDDVITEDHVGTIMRAALRMALDGNLDAIRLVLDAVIGSPRDASFEELALDLNLPDLTSAANCGLAIDRLIEAVCTGTCDRDDAKVALDVIQARLNAIEVIDLGPRIAELERRAAAGDLGGDPRRD